MLAYDAYITPLQIMAFEMAVDLIELLQWMARWQMRSRNTLALLKVP